MSGSNAVSDPKMSDRSPGAAQRIAEFVGFMAPVGAMLFFEARYLFPAIFWRLLHGPHTADVLHIAGTLVVDAGGITLMIALGVWCATASLSVGETSAELFVKVVGRIQGRR